MAEHISDISRFEQPIIVGGLSGRVTAYTNAWEDGIGGFGVTDCIVYTSAAAGGHIHNGHV